MNWNICVVVFTRHSELDYEHAYVYDLMNGLPVHNI